MKRIIIFLLCYIGFTYIVWANEDRKGERCPDFTYQDINGKNVSLKDFRGKYVFIDMWGTWCMPCQHEVPFMQVLEQEFANDNIVFVSIAHEKDKSGEKWRKQVCDMKLEGIQLLAHDKKFAEKVGLRGFPTFVLIDPKGRFISSKFPYRPSNPECRNYLLKLLRGEKECDMKREVLEDAKIRKGTLSNGLTYYIAQNDVPKGHAGFYLIRNAGALMETDAQNGLAHFLEHMAFNGTINFPGNSMQEMLKRNGIENFNAYTNQNETVYYIADVPVKKEGLIDSCLLVLHDWCYYLTLDSIEVDAERGIIVEELRGRQNATLRVREKYLPVLYGENSQYVKRNIGGKPEIIKTFPISELRKFYHDWYRTDLTALAIVGSIDPELVETKILRLFENIPAESNVNSRPFYKIECPYKSKYVLATDQEMMQTSIYQYRLGREEKKGNKVTYFEVRRELIEELTRKMLEARVTEECLKREAPFTQGRLSSGTIERGYTCYALSVLPKSQEKEGEALENLLTIQEQALRYGFTNSELKRQKKNLWRFYEMQKRQIHMTSNMALASEIQNNFLLGTPILDFNSYYQAVQEVLSTISTADVWSQLKEWSIMCAPITVIVGPEGKHLTEEDVNAIEKRVKEKKIDAYEDFADDETFLDVSKLPGAPVINERQRPDLKAVEWELKNGAKVVFRYSSVEPDDVSFYAFSKGGCSLYDEEFLPAAREGVTFTMKRFGLGNYDRATLVKKNAGKTVIMIPSISDLKESISGAACVADVERLLQMVYLWFMNPRFDDEELQDILKMNYERLKVKEKDPEKIIADSLLALRANYKRVMFLNEEYLSKLTMDRIKKVVRERFSNAADFTFCFVGNIPEIEIKTLVEKYIGSITSSDNRENWKDNGVRPPKGTVRKVIPIPMQEKKATTYIEYHKSMDYSWSDELKLEMLNKILGERLMKAIREKESATYVVNSRAWGGNEPYDFFRLSCSFSSDCYRIEALRNIVFQEIDRIQKNGVTEEEFQRIRAAMIEAQKAMRLPQKFYNMGRILYLSRYYMTGINDEDPQDFEEIVKRFVPEDIRVFACRFFDHADLLDVTFIPDVMVHEIDTSLSSEQVVAEIAARFPGKMILLDSWGTWCGSCIYAMRDMKPLKEELKRMGVQYVYVFVADESSPLEKWQKMIANIPGEHFRLTTKQFDDLRKTYKIPGAPGFLIIDRVGKVVWHSVGGFPGVEVMKEAMLREWNKDTFNLHS